MISSTPLTDGVLDEATDFLRTANPFSQHTWGWETGRFIDWRWGGNVLRDAANPGFFERHGTVVRRDGAVVALVLAEVGADDHCILTAAPDADLVGAALDDLIARREGDRLICYPSDEAAWLHAVLTRRGFTRGAAAGLEWAYDLDAVAEPGIIAGYTIDGLSGEHEFPAIDRCLEGAFGGVRDRVTILRSLSTNPLFRPELNVVARTGDGTVAAYCRGTVDPDTGLGSIDPVAVHPDHQRRGLGRAIVLTCFARQRALGGRTTYIGSAPEGSAGSRLYRALEPAGMTIHSEWSLALR